MNRQENHCAPPRPISQKHLRQKRSLTVSAAAIGFASVVAASSNAVTGFSVATLPAKSNPKRVHVRRKSRKTNYLSGGAASSARISSRIWFRESDEHEHANRRQEHDEAVAAVASEHMNRHGDDKALAAWSAWLEPLMQMPVRKPKNDGNKQLVLDDYLEFLDRRYNRLHRNDMEETPIGINTAYDWLMNRSPSSQTSSACQQDDSLCVLGLAELASKDLLRKHNLPFPEERPLKIVPASSVVIETNSSVESTMPDPVTPAMKPTPSPHGSRAACIATIKSSLSAGARILRRLQVQRDAILAKQMHKILIVSMRRSARNALSLAKKAISLGGGRQNLQLATAVVLSFLIILRPIFAAVMQG